MKTTEQHSTNVRAVDEGDNSKNLQCQIPPKELIYNDYMVSTHDFHTIHDFTLVTARLGLR